MKKTERNQNMPDQSRKTNEPVNTSSLPMDTDRQYKERYSDSNLNRRSGKQRYDDETGTVENGIG